MIMRIPYFLIINLLILVSCNQHQDDLGRQSANTYVGPVRLLPANPHYFEYKGSPLVLITSAEHYGALLNRAFDYKKYLQTLGTEGMNYTRIFAGTYAEIPGESFGIHNNTLAPKPDDFLTPWTFSLIEGKRMYDLDKWNDEYFLRLHDLVKTAAEEDIIIEFTFFTSIYRDEHWEINPENPENNINIDHEITRFQAHTPDNGVLIRYQEQLVRKIVRELNGYDNIFFELQNEPWADHNVPVYNIINKEDLNPNDWTYKVDMANERALQWQDMITGYIIDEESGLEKKHLIAQNYCNFKAPLANINDNISILNFHYAWPEAVEWNYSFKKVIGFDESGFAGSGDQVYRRQAWRFILSGGGLFNNLDYSFFTGYEDGTLENQAPGGGSPTLRQQLKILSDFIHSFELERMKPDNQMIEHAPGVIPYVLSDPGNVYAVFLQAVNVHRSELELKLPYGHYRVDWMSTLDGEVIDTEEIVSTGNLTTINVVFTNGEIAAKVSRL